MRYPAGGPDPGRDEPGALDRLFPLFWSLFRVTMWAAMLVVLVPQLLGMIGHEPAYRWMRAHGWVRWMAFPLLAPFFVLSNFQLLKVRRAPGSSGDDSATGEPPEPSPGLDATLGLRVGEALQWSLEGRAVEAGTWVSKGNRQFVAQAVLPASPGFAFSARDPRLEPAWMRGLAQQAIRTGVEQMRKSRPGMAAALDAMEFLTRDPVPLPAHPLAGDLLLRASDPSRAIELFADADVVREIRSLEGLGGRWALSLMPEGANGECRLRFECPGSDRSPERVEAVKGLMGAVLRRLAG